MYTVLLDEADQPNTVAAGLFDDYESAERYRDEHWDPERSDFDGTSRVIQIEPNWGAAR